MSSENKENSKQFASESVIRRLMKGIIKTVFWVYLLSVLIVAVSIGLMFVLYYFMSIYHVMKILQVFSISILGIMCLGILFKLLRKRTVILPLFVLIMTFVVQNLSDYLPGITYLGATKKTAMATYKNQRKIFTNTLSNKSGIIASTSDSDIVPTESLANNSLKIITESPLSTFDMSKNPTSYTNIRGYLTKNKLPPKNTVRVAEIINYFPYDYALPKTKDQPFVIQTTLTDSPWKKGNKLLHIGLKGYEQEKEKFPIADEALIQVEFNPEKVADYRLIGYQKSPDGQENQIDAGKIDSGHAMTAIYEITPTDPLLFKQSNETALVRVKYKLPGETNSEVIEQTVVGATELDHTSDDVRFAIAAAAFGEKLKNSRSVNWTWRNIRDFAKSAQHKDKSRQEFITLVKKAEDLIKAEKYDPNC